SSTISAKTTSSPALLSSPFFVLQSAIPHSAFRIPLSVGLGLWTLVLGLPPSPFLLSALCSLLSPSPFLPSSSFFLLPSHSAAPCPSTTPPINVSACVDLTACV